MNQQKTVESRVLSILKDCPRARFDDMILIMHYYNRYATYLRAGELPLNDLAFNYKVYGLPCFETIRRARQSFSSNPTPKRRKSLLPLSCLPTVL